MEWNQSALENLAHIAYAAGLNGYYSGNFIEDRAAFIVWAEAFYRKYRNEEDNGWGEAEEEWIEAIDAFIDEKLSELNHRNASTERTLMDSLMLARDRLEINDSDHEEDEAIEALNWAIMNLQKEREKKHHG